MLVCIWLAVPRSLLPILASGRPLRIKPGGLRVSRHLRALLRWLLGDGARTRQQARNGESRALCEMPCFKSCVHCQQQCLCKRPEPNETGFWDDGNLKSASIGTVVVWPIQQLIHLLNCLIVVIDDLQVLQGSAGGSSVLRVA